jgi:hypothetical protein
VSDESKRTVGLEWFKSHASWELAKWIFERFILAPIFAWLISLGYARMIHAALGTAFNVFLILFGIMGLIWTFGFIPNKGKSDESQQSRRESALRQLNELITRGHYLVGEIPKNGATASDFARFWKEQMGAWSKRVGTILDDGWGKGTQDFFLSTTGVNWEQPLERIHAESKTDYLYLSRWLQNLETLRQTLTKD